MLEARTPQLHAMPVSTLNDFKHPAGKVLEMSAEGGGVFDFIRQLGARLEQRNVMVAVLVTKA